MNLFGSKGYDLVVTHGPRKGEVIAIEQELFAIGSDDRQVHLLLDGPSVAAKHAVIYLADGKLSMENFAANATRLNNKIVPILESQPLKAGDRIQIGAQSAFRIKASKRAKASGAAGPKSFVQSRAFPIVLFGYAMSIALLVNHLSSGGSRSLQPLTDGEISRIAENVVSCARSDDSGGAAPPIVDIVARPDSAWRAVAAEGPAPEAAAPAEPLAPTADQEDQPEAKKSPGDLLRDEVARRLRQANVASARGDFGAAAAQYREIVALIPGPVAPRLRERAAEDQAREGAQDDAAPRDPCSALTDIWGRLNDYRDKAS